MNESWDLENSFLEMRKYYFTVADESVAGEADVEIQKMEIIFSLEERQVCLTIDSSSSPSPSFEKSSYVFVKIKRVNQKSRDNILNEGGGRHKSVFPLDSFS